MDWQPIETAPMDGTEFLAYDPVVGKFDVCYGELLTHIRADRPDLGCRSIETTQWESTYGRYDNDFDPDRATHWMPLPPPPVPHAL